MLTPPFLRTPVARASARAVLARGALVALPLVAVGLVVWVQAWHGPTLLTLSATHGLDTGDLIGVPFLLAGIAGARHLGVRRWRPPRAVFPGAAITLGALLVLSVLLTSEGGPLVPAGGATLNGRITQTMATHRLDIDSWTNIALTYDGKLQRLYVDGDEVAHQPAAGSIQTPGNPLWIGGNRPYGEHFKGLIDDVRVYDRALSGAEVRRDMAAPVRSVPGLVAGYGFNRGSGRLARDASGNGNDGTVLGARRAPGHTGDALRFDGKTTLVRVPSSTSLDATRAVTLSAWVRPTDAQSGWRAVVQRQTDAFFLSASSGQVNPNGAAEGVRFGLILAATAAFVLALMTGAAPRSAARRRWWVPVLLFTGGALADAALWPVITLFAPVLVALWLAATATRRLERAALLAAAGIGLALTVASVLDLAGARDALWELHGATARSVLLGALFVLGGLAAARSEGEKSHPGRGGTSVQIPLDR